MSQQNKSDTESDDLFDEYSEFAKVLRTWFVAYGIGGPVLLISNETVQTKIAHSGFAVWIVIAFLGGVVLQVGMALVIKAALWTSWQASSNRRLKKKCRYYIAKCILNDFWGEFLADATSLISFVVAAYLVYKALTT